MTVTRTAPLLFLAMLAPAAALADRELGGFVQLSQRPDYLATADGEQRGFVFAVSGSGYALSVVDTGEFEEYGPFGFADAGGSRARGLAAGPGGEADGIAAVASNDGWVDFFRLGDLDEVVLTGASPFGDFHEADIDNDPLSGLAIDALGTRTFAGVPSSDTVAINFIESGALAGTISLNRTPVSAVTYSSGFAERVYFGCDDGHLAFVDTGTLTPAVSAIAPATNTISGLAIADFGPGAVRLIALDSTDDVLYVVNPDTNTVVTSAGLGGDAVAVAVSGADATTTIWVAIEDSTGGHRVEAFTSALASAQPAIPLPAAPRSLVERDGWLFAGLADSRLAVITERPFVEITATSPDPVVEDDQDLSLTFVSSQSGDARVLFRGNEVASADVIAVTPVTVVVEGAELEDALELGRNRFRVEVVSATGLTGHDEVVVIFDEIPGAPRNFEVGFGNERVIARWDTPAGADDIAYYLVYFGTAPDDESGTASQPSPAQENGHEYVVDVPNGTEVWMSVAAVDSGGNISPRAGPQSAIAQRTAGAAELAGDEGGFLCSVSALGRGAAHTLSALFLGALALLAFRRRSTT